MKSIAHACILEILDCLDDVEVYPCDRRRATSNLSMKPFFGRFANATSERHFVLVRRNIGVYVEDISYHIDARKSKKMGTLGDLKLLLTKAHRLSIKHFTNTFP